MSNRLAIIIPAYKDSFLRQTLESISCQTCKNFTVYIGDDCSPFKLYDVVQLFTNKINIVYHRFDTNLGASNLVGQWKRCVEMSTQEPLIWFFSDDDVMPSDAVERILNASKNRDIDNCFFRFPLEVIDEKGDTLIPPRVIEEQITSYQFLIKKLDAQIDSAACECIFSRAIYNNTGGFVNFPMAWCSDDATWIKFSNGSGMTALPGNPVGWRNVEGCNISNSNQYNAQKVEATASFILWLQSFYGNQLKNKVFRRALRHYVHTILHYSLNNSYTNKQLLFLCKAISSVSRTLALYIYFKNKK